LFHQCRRLFADKTEKSQRQKVVDSTCRILKGKKRGVGSGEWGVGKRGDRERIRTRGCEVIGSSLDPDDIDGAGEEGTA
jgi:hydrogenase maturation factor HypE